MKRIVIESPYAADTVQGRKDNITYLRRCLRDSLMRGEAPFASHAIYTQYGVLDDGVPEERSLGIAAGIEWGSSTQSVAVYVDRGISSGMKQGIAAAVLRGASVEIRALDRAVINDDLKSMGEVAGPTRSVRLAEPATKQFPCDDCGKLIWCGWFRPGPGAKVKCGACCDPPREEAPNPAEVKSCPTRGHRES